MIGECGDLFGFGGVQSRAGMKVRARREAKAPLVMRKAEETGAVCQRANARREVDRSIGAAAN